MNKKSLLSLLLFAASTVLSFATIHIMSLFDISKWVGVSVGIALLVVMLVLVLIFKKHMAVKITALVVNSIADGLAISSLFVHFGAFPHVWQSVAAFAALVGAFVLYMLLTYIPFTRRHYIISMAIYALIVLGVFLTVMLTTKKACAGIFALALIYYIVFISYFVSLALSASDLPEHISHISYASFYALAVVIIVVLIILSDGNFDATPDFVGFNGGSKKRNPYALG